MIKRTLCFGSQAYLSLHLGQLVIRQKNDQGEEVNHTRPIEDLGIVVLESQSITITTALLDALMQANVAVLVCDHAHMPSGLMVGYDNNTLTGEKSLAQVNCSKPLQKQLWQQTVMAKIRNQAKLLENLTQSSHDCMWIWANTVRSGDLDNLEARAAVYYWKNIFGSEAKFKRGDENNPKNSFLNYGYAILRAIVARALVSSGLMPQIGLFHRNKYNSFPLADDIMEPYRPYVDKVVYEIINEDGKKAEIDKEIKTRLLTIPVLDVTINGRKRPLMVAVSETTASLASCFTGESRKIAYPVM